MLTRKVTARRANHPVEIFANIPPIHQAQDVLICRDTCCGDLIRWRHIIDGLPMPSAQCLQAVNHDGLVKTENGRCLPVIMRHRMDACALVPVSLAGRFCCKLLKIVGVKASLATNTPHIPTRASPHAPEKMRLILKEGIALASGELAMYWRWVHGGWWRPFWRRQWRGRKHRRWWIR